MEELVWTDGRTPYRVRHRAEEPSYVKCIASHDKALNQDNTTTSYGHELENLPSYDDYKRLSDTSISNRLTTHKDSWTR